jgi:serine beta-lactamase-like protein LACTB
MNPYPYISILFLLILLLALFRWRWVSSTSTDPQPAYCAEGSVSIHPASEQAGKILEAALAKDKGTGISAAVVMDGELVFARAFSRAGQKFKLGTNARMRTGSVAKLFTAVAAAKLVEMNRLDLHAPIATLVPEIPSREITPYQLGTHTSGIRHYNFGKIVEANNQVHYQSLSDALKIFASNPLLAEPGAEFHYSSFGFNLLGLFVERAYGAPYDVALRELVATPLGLSSLSLDDAKMEIPCRAAFNTIVFGRWRINAPGAITQTFTRPADL